MPSEAGGGGYWQDKALPCAHLQKTTIAQLWLTNRPGYENCHDTSVQQGSSGVNAFQMHKLQIYIMWHVWKGH